MNYTFREDYKRGVVLLLVSTFILFTLLFPLISASRLPTVGGDNSTWGTILNDYLISLAGENATALNQTIVNSANINSSSVNTTHILDSTINDTDISDTTNLTLGEKITFTLGEVISNVVDEWITITGNLNVSGTINATGNISAEYFEGQPITGSIGSGIIWADGANSYAEVNITCSGLNCSWGAFKVRLVNTSNIVKYCDIVAGSRLLTNNQQSVLYIDNNCAVQEVSIQTYITMPISPGGIADFANIIAEGGNTYDPNGLGIENKRIIKLRKLLLKTMHLDVISGFNLQQGTFPQFNVTAGSYVYLMDVVDTTLQNTTTDEIETVYHINSTHWGTSEKTGLNYTYCDTGTGMALCTNTNLYRRIFIFMIGYNETTDSTKLHQLLPSQTTTYTKVADCLDTLNYPVTYTLPSFYQYGAVMLYTYCARPSDTTWGTNWIDLRTVKQSTATGSSDITSLLANYLKSDNTLMVNVSNIINAFYAYGNISNYFQINIQNLNNGTNASSDIVATSNEGNETDGYIDLGINSGNYSDEDFTIAGKNDGYLYIQGINSRIGTGNLSIGTASPGTTLKFFSGGTLISNIIGLWNSTELNIKNNLTVSGNISSASGYKINNTSGLTGNYSVGVCWQKFTGGILITTNCTSL